MSLETPIRMHVLATGTAASVPVSTTTTIVTYTVPSGNEKIIHQIDCSGTNYAKYEIFKNLTKLLTMRSGPSRNLVFDFNYSLTFDPGDIIDVKVTHYQTGYSGDYEASIIGA